MMKREINRFQAVSDDGYETTIVVYQHLIATGTMQNPNAVIGGMKEVRTVDGFACNRLNEDTFEIVNDPLRPGLIVRRAT